MMLIVSLEVQRLSGSLRVSGAIWVKKRSPGKAKESGRREKPKEETNQFFCWFGLGNHLMSMTASCRSLTRVVVSAQKFFSTSNGKTRKNGCKRSSNSHDHFQQCIYYWKQMFLHAATSQSAFVALTSLQKLSLAMSMLQSWFAWHIFACSWAHLSTLRKRLPQTVIGRKLSRQERHTVSERPMA